MKGNHKEYLSGDLAENLPAQSLRMSGAERRQQILDAATLVFSEKGFRGATTKEIACRAKVNEALIFRHFNGKDALYDAILKARTNENRFAGSWKRLAAIAESRNDFGVFTTAGKFIIERKTSERDFLRVLMYGILENRASVEHLLEAQLRPLSDFLVEYIKRRQSENAFRLMEAQPAVNAFIGMTMHHMMTAELHCKAQCGKKDAEEIAVFARIILADLRNCPAENIVAA